MTTAHASPGGVMPRDPVSATGEPAAGGRSVWPARGVMATLAAAAAAIITVDVLNPRYSPVSEVVSRYVNGTAGWLVTAATVAIGLASAVVVGLAGRSAGLGTGGRIGRCLLAVWTGGVLIAGVVPADPPGRWSRPSTSDMVHGSAAWLAFAVFPVAAVLLTRALSARPGRIRLIVSAVASVLTTVVMTVFLVDVMGGPSMSLGGAPTLVGLAERFAIVADLSWLAFAAVALGRTPRSRGGSDARA